MDDYKFTAEISNANKDGVILKETYDEMETQEEKSEFVKEKINYAIKCFELLDSDLSAVDNLIQILCCFIALLIGENSSISNTFDTDYVLDFLITVALNENPDIEIYIIKLFENITSQSNKSFSIKIYHSDLLQFLLDKANNGDEGSRAHAIGTLYNIYNYIEEISAHIEIYSQIDFQKMLLETIDRDLEEHYRLIHLIYQYIPGIVEHYEPDNKIFVKIAILINITFCEIDDENSISMMNEFTLVLAGILKHAKVILPMLLNGVDDMNFITSVHNTYNSIPSLLYLRILKILSYNTDIMDSESRSIIYSDLTFEHFLLYKKESRNYIYYDALSDFVGVRPDLLDKKEAFILFYELCSSFENVEFRSRRKCAKSINRMIAYGNLDYSTKIPESFYEIIISNIEYYSDLTDKMIDILMTILNRLGDECFLGGVKQKFLELGIDDAVAQLLSEIDETSYICHRCKFMMHVITGENPYEEDEN